MFSRDRLIKAIDNSACLTRRQIDDYLQNKLYPEELYVVEMHLNECPFCNDAIDGYKNVTNSNELLSKIEDFNPPIVTQTVKEVKPTIEPKATKQNNSNLNTSKTEPSNSKKQENPFADYQKKSKNSIWPIGVAACLGIGLAIWGFSKFSSNDGKSASEIAANTNQDSSSFAVPKAGTYSSKEDSIMNARYAFDNQTPLSASGKIIISNGNQNTEGIETDSTIAAAEEVTVAANTNANAEKANNSFIGPVMPKDDESKAKTMAATTKMASKSTTSATTIAPSAKTASSKPANQAEVAKPVAVAKKEDKSIAKKSAETNTKNAEVANSKTTATNQLAQAEKDFNKGLDLYNKKQFSASIMYFQAAAKINNFAKRKQAESYIKLAKNEINNLEKKKKSENK